MRYETDVCHHHHPVSPPGAYKLYSYIIVRLYDGGIELDRHQADPRALASVLYEKLYCIEPYYCMYYTAG